MSFRSIGIYNPVANSFILRRLLYACLDANSVMVHGGKSTSEHLAASESDPENLGPLTMAKARITHNNSLKFIVRRELLAREFLMVMILGLLLMILALLFPAGYTIAEPEDAASCVIEAPWLIVWIQVLLRYFPPIIAGVFIPFAVFLLMAALPWLPWPGNTEPAGRYWFGFHQALLLAIAAALTILTFRGL